MVAASRLASDMQLLGSVLYAGSPSQVEKVGAHWTTFAKQAHEKCQDFNAQLILVTSRVLHNERASNNIQFRPNSQSSIFSPFLIFFPLRVATGFRRLNSVAAPPPPFCVFLFQRA